MLELPLSDVYQRQILPGARNARRLHPDRRFPLKDFQFSRKNHTFNPFFGSSLFCSKIPQQVRQEVRACRETQEARLRVELTPGGFQRSRQSIEPVDIRVAMVFTHTTGRFRDGCTR